MQTRSSTFPTWVSKLFLNRSLRVRLMSLLGTISLLTFLFCATSVIYFVSRSESASWRGRQGEAARSAARAVADIIQNTENTLVYLAQLHPAETDSVVIQNEIGPHAELLEVIRLDNDGKVIASASRDRLVLANLFTIHLSEWFKRAQAGERYYGGVQLSSDMEPYIVVAFPTIEGGVIAARLRMEVLWTVVADIRFGTSGRAYVINQNEQVIAHTDPAVVLAGTNLSNQPELYDLEKAAGHEWYGDYVNFEGNSVVVVSAPIGSTGWILITELSQAEAYATTYTAAIVLGGSILLFMIIIMVLARAFLHLSVLAPMEKLRSGAERIGQGDLNHRIDLQQRDEIGLVATALNAMVSNLHEREQQLSAQAFSLVSEVAERTRAELELRQSEARYRAIVEDQTELICRFHADGTLTFVNDAYCRYFGKPRDELVGYPFTAPIPVEDHPYIEAQLGSLSPEHPMTTCENRVLIGNDEVRWMQWTDRLISGTNGSLVEFQSVGRDVTNRRQAEEEIRYLNADLERRVVERTEQLAAVNGELKNEIAERERVEVALRISEAQYRTIVETAQEGIWLIDSQGATTYANPKMAEMFGYKPDEMIGRSLFAFMDHAGQLIAQRNLERRRQGIKEEHEFRFKHKDGRDVWTSMSTNPIMDDQGQFVSALGMVTDITERKQHEDSLRMSEMRLRDAQAIAHIGSWEWNIPTSEVYWSDEVYRIFGHLPQEFKLYLDTFLQKVYPDDLDGLEQAVYAAFDGEPYLIVHRIVRSDGEIRWVQQHGQVTFDQDRMPVRLVGTTQDITELKQAEDLIRASLREKEILLKEIHHRVKNNLQIISSLLNLQSNSISDPLTLAQFQDSQNRVRSMALIHERLYRSDDLAQIDFGPYLRDLVNSLVQTYRRQIQSITLKIEADVVLLDIDTAIPCGLIVNELVSNALKHGFPDGRTGEIGVEIRQESTQGQYRLLVRDDGVGMAEDVDYRNTPSLGLQLVNSLCKQIGGNIDLCQEGGTQFVIRFSGPRKNEGARLT